MSCRRTVAQSVERPSKLTVWFNSTDVGLNHATANFSRIKIVEKNNSNRSRAKNRRNKCEDCSR